MERHKKRQLRQEALAAGPRGFNMISLRNRADFERVRRTGRSWTHPFAVLVAGANNLPHSRFGFVASRQVGNAVVRNRSKRVLRAAVRATITQVPAGWDVILIARNGLRQRGLAEALVALRHLLRAAALRQPSAAAGA
ncbi:MAG: ribonuclease P protein component [Chloroflexi bacterium]|nr:MAG: ribonuclease P protein component [Chloroflexota bacterium]